MGKSTVQSFFRSLFNEKGGIGGMVSILLFVVLPALLMIFSTMHADLRHDHLVKHYYKRHAMEAMAILAVQTHSAHTTVIFREGVVTLEMTGGTVKSTVQLEGRTYVDNHPVYNENMREVME